MSRRRKYHDVHYYCKKCGKEIMVVEKVLYNNLCTNCHIKEEDNTKHR